MGINAYSSSGSLSFEMKNRIETELDRDEKLVWCARQIVSRGHVLRTLPVAIFGLFFGGFALFWIMTALSMTGGQDSNGSPSFFRYVFPLFGIPFLLVGAAMVTSPFWILRRAKKTMYALTTKRAIVWQAGLFGGMSVSSLGREDLKGMIRNEYGDGSGDLVFQRYTTMDYSDGPGNYRHLRIGFLGIENVREVERQVRETLLRDETD